MSRRDTRETAMKLLFQMSINKESVNEVIDNFKDSYEEELSSIDFSYVTMVMQGVQDNIVSIDEVIEKNLRNWKIDRIPKIDLAILRLAVYEIKYNEEVPQNVAINEAIELSKKYCDDKSSSFINGVLDSIIKA